MNWLLPKQVLVAIFLTISSPFQTHAGEEKVVFYLDEHYYPVAKPERLSPMSDGAKAILGMYALQNGGGCQGHNESGLQCKLTSSLGLGAQCSEQHIGLVRSWFRNEMPKMSGYADRYYKGTELSEGLKSICYKAPEGASRQRVWEIIRATQNENRLLVDAIGGWVTPNGAGRFRYESEYKIEKEYITVVAHKEIPISRNTK